MKAIVILTATVLGQCGPQGCPSPSPATRVEGRDYYVVRTYPVNHDGLTFPVKGYKNAAGKITWRPEEYGNQGAWDAAKSAKAAASERKPKAEPGPPPAGGDQAAKPVGETLNFGMEPAKMRLTPTYTVPSAEARRFVREARNDAGNPGQFHVTVIGTADERAPVVNDLLTSPVFAELKPSMMVQDYDKGDWAVDPSLGFVATGKPTIIVQSAKGPNDPKGGRVVYRASDYSMGAEALAEEIRKGNPDYKPSVDPGPSTGKPSLSACPLGFTRDQWPYILAVGVGLLVLITLPRKGA